jgi:DMSO/TMAO reductase YedYZ molybdopterin-dependent catalytic subunit
LQTPRTFLTDPEKFVDVSRGNPVPHSLKGEALVNARLTPEAWRLEITAESGAKIDKSRTLEAGNALDLPTLLELGKKKGVRFLKAMQCNNIPLPLGQGLWEGVPLRDVLHLVGGIENARRVFFWGFHNNDEKQMFRSSLSMNQVFDSPPGELPAFVAYRLNGGPIPLTRGGPVRMLIPWAHGFKSIKWLQRIVITNDHRANDTYADANNDPESYLKTAAYFLKLAAETFAVGQPITIQGAAMVGWPGLAQVEYWLRQETGAHGVLADNDPAWLTASWRRCDIDPPPGDWHTALPTGIGSKDVWGFDPRTGKPKEWPMRFSVATWSVTLNGLKPGGYELRVRTVDKNGFAQPEPRPVQQAGLNRIQCKQFVVV